MKKLVNRKTLFGIAILAGMIVSTANAQPANAQMMDILKNALGGQLQGAQAQYGYGDPFNNYGNALNGAGSSGISGLLNQFLPGQATANPYVDSNQNYLYNTPSTGGGGLLSSLLPLVQNSSVGSGLLNNYLPQSQLSSPYGSNYPTNLGGNFTNGFPGYQNFASVDPVVFNGVSLDSEIYSGPYRGTPHQVESAMNLDWQMTVLKEQIGLGAAHGNLTPSDANMFSLELNGLARQKQRAVRRNGLGFNDSQALVERLNDLVNRVRQAWYNQTAFNGTGHGWGNQVRRGRGRFAQSRVYGQVLSPGRNETLEKLYLMTQPAGFRR